MRDYVDQICRELGFPGEAAAAMRDAWEVIERSPQVQVWKKWIDEYDRNVEMDLRQALAEAQRSAGEVGVHPYTAGLLLFLLLSRRLRELYDERGIARTIFHDSCMDLYWKLMECKRMYGIWGSFVAWWFPGFFRLTRFALGRLQFELVDFPKDYESLGHREPCGLTKAINVHVPSSGKLTERECLQSYWYAAEFFRKAFAGGRIAFCCVSWLLYTPHRDFLKKDSGVIRFMDAYDVYRLEESEEDLWRIFNYEYDGNPDRLPEDTGMQRGYKEWLRSGHRAGYGFGVFLTTYDALYRKKLQAEQE